jgi:hypothetical protein
MKFVELKGRSAEGVFLEKGKVLTAIDEFERIVNFGGPAALQTLVYKVMTKKGRRLQEKSTLSRWNSLKHGLLAKTVVLTWGPLKEDEKEFEQLLSDLRNDLSPVGALEEMLVEEIAVCYWRIRRVLRAETGEITSAAFGAVPEWGLTEKIRKLARGTGDLTDEDYVLAFHTTAGLDYVLSLLDKIASHLGTDSPVPPSLMNAVRRFFAKTEIGDELIAFTHLASTPVEQRTPLLDKKWANPQDARRVLLGLISIEETYLLAQKKLVSSFEGLQRQLELLQASLPLTNRLDTIARYETTLKRHFYRALDELERLKRIRGGEAVPPPLKVNLSK